MTRRVLLASAAVAAALASSPAATAAGAEAVPPTPGGTVLEEIIITAEKRETRLQQAPLAISAFTANQRDLKGISSVQDIANFTPGLAYAGTSDRTSLRGLTRLTTSFTADASVAIYHDEVYTTRTFLVGLSDLFVERVEVQRGPQGTLEGRNAIGGVIKTYLKRPTQDWSGEVRATLGSYERRTLEATVSGPIGEGLAFRLSGSRIAQDEGYFHNLSDGSEEGRDLNRWYVNGQLQWTPTERDHLWFNVSAHGWKNQSLGPGSLIGVPEVGPYDTDLRNYPTSGATFNPNFGYSTQTGFAPGTPGGAPLGQALGPVPGSVVGIPAGTSGNPALRDVREFARSVRGRTDLRDAHALGLIYIRHFGAFDAKYVGGYNHYDYSLVSAMPSGGNSAVTSYRIPLNPNGACAQGFLGPCAALQVFPTHRLESPTKDKWHSHELTLTGTADGPLQWVAGGYYFSETYSNPTTISLPDQPQMRQPAFAVSAIGGIGPAAPNPDSLFVLNGYTFRTRSIAGYGQLSWAVTDAITLTGGLRYTHDRKTGIERNRLVTFSSLLGAGDPRLTALNAENMGSQLPAVDITQVAIGFATMTTAYKGVTCLPRLAADGAVERCLGAESDALTGTAGVEWRPAESLLAYARYNRGYKALGFNAGAVTASPVAEAEYLNDFELGLKQTIGRSFQYNLSAFYYDYRDAQVPVQINNGASISTVFFNIPKSVSWGVEVQGEWIPVRNLALTLSYAFNDSEIKSGCAVVGGTARGACFVDALDPLATGPQAQPVAAVGGNVVQSVEGAALPQASRHRIALNATYTWDLSIGDVILSGSYVWRDETYSGIFQRDYNRAPAWDQMDLRATWRSPGERYAVVGYVRNVFDTLGYTVAVDGTATFNGSAAPSARNNIYELAPPRTYGLELRYRF